MALTLVGCLATAFVAQTAWPVAGSSVIVGPGQPMGKAKFHAKGDVVVKDGALVVNGGILSVGAVGQKVAGLEILLIGNSDGLVATFGTTKVLVKQGKLLIASAGKLLPAGPAPAGAPIHLVFSSGTTGKLFVNGNPVMSATSSTLPFSVGGNGWTGALLGATSFDKPILPPEVLQRWSAAKGYAAEHPVETASITVEGELESFTDVPDPARIKPYRNALIAQEYVVRNILSGHTADVAKGTRIRVFRWGVLDGEPTGLTKQKKGDVVKMTLIKLAGNLKYEREYQVDDLDTDVTMSYYVDETKNP